MLQLATHPPTLDKAIRFQSYLSDVFRPMKQEMSVLYKNKGGPMINNPIQDNAHLLKHDENNDVIHFPTNTPNTG